MKQMTNLLGLYGGCDADELRRIRKLPSRWVALCTSFPSIVLYEKGCYLLHGEQPTEDKTSGKKRPVQSGISSEPKAQKTGSGYGGAGGGGKSESESDSDY
jgi:hypothetical protein